MFPDHNRKIVELRERISKFPPHLAMAATRVLAAYERHATTVILHLKDVELVVHDIELHLIRLCPEHRMSKPACPIEHVREAEVKPA